MAIAYTSCYHFGFLNTKKMELKDQLKNIIENYTQDLHYDDVENISNEIINEFKKYSWIKYSHKKPEIGQEVLVYRDIESKQKYVTIWSLEDEKYADWNDVTFWTPILTPVE